MAASRFCAVMCFFTRLWARETTDIQACFFQSHGAGIAGSPGVFLSCPNTLSTSYMHLAESDRPPSLRSLSQACRRYFRVLIPNFTVSLAALNKQAQQGRKQSLKHFFRFAAESVNGAKVGQWACDRHIKGREMDRFFTTDHRLCRVCSCRCSSPYSIPDCDSEQNLKNE